MKYLPRFLRRWLRGRRYQQVVVRITPITSNGLWALTNLSKVLDIKYGEDSRSREELSPETLRSVMKGLEAAKRGEFSKNPPDLDADADLANRIPDQE